MTTNCITCKIHESLSSARSSLREAEQKLKDMRNDEDYLKCKEAWNIGIGHNLHGKNSEDCQSWWDAIDNQRALIDSYLDEIRILEKLLN